MDVSKRYYEILQKYALLDLTQELALYETYLRICREYFAANPHTKAAIYGAGRNTAEIMSSTIWKDICCCIKVIVDNHSQLKEMQGIPIIQEKNLGEYGIDTVMISSWDYRKEMAQSIAENFPGIVTFDPYVCLLEKLPEINVPFFGSRYRADQKYQWFAERNRELESAVDSDSRQKPLRALVHGYYAICDWVDFRKTLRLYISGSYADQEKYQALEREVDLFLGDIQREIENRKQRDCLIFLVDALSKYIVNDMPRLSDWKKQAVSFDNYICEYPATREVLTALLTGWHCFEDKTYLSKKISLEDSDLLKFAKKSGMEIKLISSISSRENYSEINCYQQKWHEDKLLTENLFRGICELLKSDHPQLIIMHTYDTVHGPYYHPLATELARVSAWEKYKEQFHGAVLFTDQTLDFYLKMLEGNRELTRIVMGDHGLNLKSEYAYFAARVPIDGGIGPWDLESISPACIIWNKNLQPRTISKFVSSSSFASVLNAVIQNEDLDAVLGDRKFLELEFVPGYDEEWMKNILVVRQNYCWVIGMKGILTHHFVFASFEDGTERLFEIHGKDIVECNDRLKEFIDEVGEENYAACKFPEELLKDSFFDAHRRCFQEYRLNVHPD